MKTLDGQGNIQIYTFKVSYDVGEPITKQFVDHTDGWNWARAMKADWEGIDAENKADISYDWDWMSLDEWERQNG